MEIETRVRQPQAKECLQRELEEVRKVLPLELTKGIWACQFLGFKLEVSRVVIE